MVKTNILLAALAAVGVSGLASGATVFSANFEDGGTDADTGTLTVNAATTVLNVATAATDATLGDNVLMVDQSATVVDFDLVFTDTLSLAGSNTVTFSFDVAARRTNGNSKTHKVTGYDSNGDEVFQLVLGDSDEYGNGGGDRQRPGFGTSSGTTVLPAPSTPGSFWWGADTNPTTFAVTPDASFDLTIGNGGWDVTTTKQGGASTYSTASPLALFNGGTATDLVSISIVSNGANAGNYWDNFQVDGTVVPEPGSLALLGLGGLMMVKRRRRA